MNILNHLVANSLSRAKVSYISVNVWIRMNTKLCGYECVCVLVWILAVVVSVYGNRRKHRKMRASSKLLNRLLGKNTHTHTTLVTRAKERKKKTGRKTAWHHDKTLRLNDNFSISTFTSCERKRERAVFRGRQQEDENFVLQLSNSHEIGVSSWSLTARLRHFFLGFPAKHWVLLELGCFCRWNRPFLNTFLNSRFLGPHSSCFPTNWICAEIMLVGVLSNLKEIV